jgi:methanogenic corrinoid protein MtbC1
MYSETQIQRLLLLHRAVQQGHAIGQVAAIKNRALRALLDNGDSLAADPLGGNTGSEELLAPVLHAIDRFDYARADLEIGRLAAAMGRPRDFVHQAALPLMRTMGTRWHQGRASIAQEHMLSHLLSALLASMVRTYSPSHPPKRVLFATPSNERHEFPNLAAAMLTAVGGLGVVYLGTDLPAPDIVLAARKSGADVVLLSLGAAPNAAMLAEIKHVARKAPRSAALWLGGAPELRLEEAAGSRWQVLRDFDTFERHLSALGARF